MGKNDIGKVLSILSEQQGVSTMLGRLSERYDPFKVLISTILSARAKDEVTEVIAEELLKKYPTADALARARPADIKRIIHSIGFYNAKTRSVIGAAKMVRDEFGGKVPDNLDDLVKLPGVGRKVANCVLVYSFGKDAIPVDTHVHRIANQLGWIKTKSPEESEQELMRIIPRKYWQQVNDTFVSHGKTVCVPISPFCSKCPVAGMCKRVGVTRHR